MKIPSPIFQSLRLPGTVAEHCRDICRTLASKVDFTDYSADANIDVIRRDNVSASQQETILAALFGEAAQRFARDWDFVYCQQALPHLDWNTTFLSLVIGVDREVLETPGYELCFSAERPEMSCKQLDEEPCWSVEDFDAEFVHRLDIQPGFLFAFNPGAWAHWASPVAPRPTSGLLLMQWDLQPALAEDAKSIIAKRFGSAWKDNAANPNLTKEAWLSMWNRQD